MRVAALAPLAAFMVAAANAAPVPVADPFSFCFFGKSFSMLFFTFNSNASHNYRMGKRL